MTELSAFAGKIKLIALDLDDTTLNSRKEVSDVTRAALDKARAAGAHVVIVSGRPPQGVVDAARAIGSLQDSYAICFNGSMIVKLDRMVQSKAADPYREPCEILFRHTAPLRKYRPLIDLAHECGLTVHGFSASRWLMIEAPHPASLYECVVDHSEPVYYDFNGDPDEEFYKIQAVGDAAKVDLFRQKVTPAIQSDFDLMRSNAQFIEFIPGNYNKGRTLVKLCEILGVKIDECVAFGDAENDLKMIQAAGLGVAMGNAMDIVKQHCDYITRTNDEDGVAYVLNQLF